MLPMLAALSFAGSNVVGLLAPHRICLPPSLCAVSPEGERWAEALMAAAKTKRDLPALAGGRAGWQAGSR